MKLIGESPQDLNSQFQELRELAGKVAAEVRPTKVGVQVPPGEDLLEWARNGKSLFILRSGVLTLSLKGLPVVAYSAGDLVGLEHALSAADISVRSELAVTVDAYDVPSVMTLADRSGLSVMAAALAIYASIFLSVYGGREGEGEGAAAITRDMRTYAPGTTIIRQGEMGSEIYTMVSGAADVFVDGVRTGEIGADEVFGALAALGQVVRTATVVAREPSLVMVINRDRLIDLIRSKPQVIERMLFDLATIVQELSTAVVAEKRHGRGVAL